MNPELIGASWDSIGKRQSALLTDFYQQLFARHPYYRPLFPATLDRQMAKMANTIAMVARLADAPELVEPHMQRLAQAHAQYRLGQQDMDNFRAVFLDVLGEYLQDDWTPECRAAWNDAFGTIIEKHMLAGAGG